MRTWAIGSLCLVISLVIFAVPVFSPVAEEQVKYALQKVGSWEQLCEPEPFSSELCIPKIRVRGSVVENSTVDLAKMRPDLQRGIVHVASSAGAGEQGNGLYFGHSDDVPWNSGQYKTIFALLGKLESGDEIFLLKNGKRFLYTVKSLEVVSPKNTSVLDAEPEKRTITLITCWPPGTTMKRLVVSADYQP